MKSEVLKRAMFAQPLSKAARNSGIMEGFDDDELENEGDDGLDEFPQMARTPQNPEILMNNLRGDIRSTDARYQELAELVGEEAAMQTPPEVLAMLQPKLAQQGIAGLAGGMPAEMPGMPPNMPAGPMPEASPAMPQGPGPEMAMPQPPAGGGIASLPMPPEMAPAPGPQGFAKGGMVVQHFKDGSDEEGVTPAAIYPPELVTAAQQYARGLATAQPRAIPSLQTAMQQRLPLYNELLGMGRSKEDMQTQMLLDIASRGLAFAGNVDEQGRPLRGSFASRLGQATRTLPNTMMALLGEQRKGEMAAKQLALQAAEKEILQVSELNAKDVESQRKLFGDILKESAKAQGQSIFGKGDWHWAVINRPNFLASWAAGKTTPEQDNLINSAITVLETPRQELRNDPVTGQTTQVTVPPMVPDFVQQAKAARQKLFSEGGPRPGAAAPAAGAPAAGGAPAAAPAAAPSKAPAEGGPSAPKAAPSTYSASDPTMFNMATMGTGPIPVAKTFIARVPILGELVDADQNIQANTFLSNAANQLNKSLATNPRFAEGERQQIMSELQLSTRLIDRPEAYQQRLIGLDTLLMDLRGKAYREGYQNPNLGPDTIRAARAKVGEIDEIRNFIGVPPRVNSKADFDLLPSGSPYILNGQIMMKR